MIQEWYLTMCKTSRYKEDLVHIKDMHRLLSFKGYRFPQVKNDSASVLNPTTVSRAHLSEDDLFALFHRLIDGRYYPQVLKSATELEEEDRAAQAAVSSGAIAGNVDNSYKQRLY
jgi:hypothetical protein